MRAGNLRNYVTIQQPASDQDDRGEDTATWTTLGQVYAEILPIGAREIDVARGFAPTVSHRIRIRYRSDVTTLMRITFDSRTFAINGAVDQDGRKRELMIFATEQL